MWEQLSINRPHLVYIILGGFTTLFMLCSSIIKERLYIGEATVATLCGIIFGPHAANLINPLTWGNPDQITLEFSRIVLVVQCFAVGVELPKAYMERHWRSVTFLLIPVMTFGWLITSLFIWAVMSPNLNWLESLTIAACVTATDPVLASSVVGKGKFAKRVPKHLRDLLSAESGCNDGMAFPFIYLGLYLLKYRPHASEVAYHWFCFTVLYECIFGAFYGVCVGYIARRAVRYAHERDLIDRESFLVFYFVLALFCAGSGSLLGLDDLLVGFAAGVGFSNDGWFTEKTEESHVSNVIDLLINLAFFVYFGTIIPWAQFNNGNLGLDVWKLVVIAILVLFFRRIPIMLALKPVIPDIKTWREALFAGHFGPIGVGAIFVAILARAELETDSTTPLSALPPESTEEYNVIYLIWPITCFLVICSIVVHGSSIAVFTLGKHINTLTLTMSYTKGNDEPSWMERLPRIQSRSKSMMSAQSLDEKSGPDTLPMATPGTFLRRQKEEDNPSRAQSRASSRRRSRSSKGKTWDYGIGPGGPVSQSAIEPARRRNSLDQQQSRSDSDTLAMRSDPPSDAKINSEDKDNVSPGEAGEIYEEGGHTVYEDEDGNVLAVEKSNVGEPRDARQRDEVREGERLMHESGADRHHGVAPRTEPSTDSGEDEKEDQTSAQEEAGKMPERPAKNWRNGLNVVGTMNRLRRRDTGGQAESKPEQPRKQASGPARAYQYGNTIIVEDEDGEVIKKYDIPGPERKGSTTADPEKSKQRLGQMSKMLGLSGKEQKDNVDGGSDKARAPAGDDDDDDDRIRFTITAGGRRMSKAQFIDQIRGMDPKSRVQAVEDSNAPEAVKREARKDFREQSLAAGESSDAPPPLDRKTSRRGRKEADTNDKAALKRTFSKESNELMLVDTNQKEVPIHNVSSDLRNRRRQGDEGETAAERRRRQALEQPQADEDSDDDGTDRVPPNCRAVPAGSTPGQRHTSNSGETAAERRRREGALGITEEAGSDSEDDNQPREPPRNIRFADQQPSQGSQPRQSVRWGTNVGR